MVSFGGPGVMLLGSVVAAGICALLARVLGWRGAALLWTVVVVGLVTLVPVDGAPGIIPADQAQSSCSFDYGGPAPDGFWILGGGQRLLNTALFVPSGVLLALLLARRRTWLVVPGVLVLAAYSVAIEATQLALTRLDRACDVTDVVDNTTGAVIGCLLGLVVCGLAWALRRGTRDPGDP